MNVKLDIILNLYELIKGTNIKEVKDTDDKYNFLKSFRILKKFHEEFEEFRLEAQQQIITNSKEFEEKLKKSETDVEAKEYVDSINRELQAVIVKELLSEKELELELITKESFIQFVNNGDFNLEQLDLLEKYLVKQ